MNNNISCIWFKIKIQTIWTNAVPSKSKVIIVMTMIYDENEDNKMTMTVMMLMLILFVMEFFESLQMSHVWAYCVRESKCYGNSEMFGQKLFILIN